MLQCAESTVPLAHHLDFLFDNLMHIMSKQPEENFYREIREQTSDEAAQIPPSTNIPFRYGENFENFYSESYFPSNPDYPEKLEETLPVGSGSLEASCPIPGPSGVPCHQNPVVVSGHENPPLVHSLSSDSSYSYSTSPVVSFEPFKFFSEDVFDRGPNVSNISTLPEISEPSKLQKVPVSRKRVARSSSQSLSSLSSEHKTSSGGAQSFDKPRRGRRRNNRRGSYSLRQQSRARAETDEEEMKLEVPETRNILEEARNAYVQIIEQPRPKALRFRYICEGRSAGSIPGVHSTPTRKTFPSIRVVNSRGPALVVVSCVTVKRPHRPHPHNLVGKEGCEDGVCSVYIHNPLMECSFSNLGIQCVKKRDIEASLSKRREKGIDPFATGFEHLKFPHTIDLNSIRLCFQVYLIDPQEQKRFPLPPIVSDPIYDKKAAIDLAIYKMSASSGFVSGGKEIILLCDKIAKDDIQVRFFEVKEGRTEWEAFGQFNSADVHKQFAISFKTPKYKDLEVKQVVKVWIQLFRPSDKSTSEPVPFDYYPVIKDCNYLEDKILHISQPSSKEVLTSDSPVESVQEASDESEMVEDQASGTISKIVKRMRSSSQSYRISKRKSKSQDSYSPRRQTRATGARTRERKLQTSFEESTSNQRPSFDQTYRPQLEGIQRIEGESEALIKTSVSTSRHSFATSILPSGPTATLALSSEVLRESENGIRSFLDMDEGNPAGPRQMGKGNGSYEKFGLNISIPDSLQPEETMEKSPSPNSESIDKLKHEIETLNKLSNL